MVHPFVVGLMKTTYRTLSGGVVKYFYFRRNTGNQKHLSPVIRRRIAYNALMTQPLFAENRIILQLKQNVILKKAVTPNAGFWI